MTMKRLLSLQIFFSRMPWTVLWIAALCGLPGGRPSATAAAVMSSAESSSRTMSVSFRGGGASSRQEGLNPLVLSSPVVAAAVCHDGIVLMALHPAAVRDNGGRQDKEDAESSIKPGPAKEDNQEQKDDDDKDMTHNLLEFFYDLPRDSAGPFRLAVLGGDTVVVATAGWRADAEYLTSVLRNVQRDERAMLGNNNVDAHVLATQCSLVLATTVLDATVRELNCVALIASADAGILWLADATGAYPVRALALGGAGKNGALNDALRRVDWTGMSAREGVKRLLQIIASIGQDDTKNRAVELAIVDVPRRRLVRTFLRDVLGTTTATA